jgi:hypothetical protein
MGLVISSPIAGSIRGREGWTRLRGKTNQLPLTNLPLFPYNCCAGPVGRTLRVR